jgi:hypothetical protein
MNRSNILLFVSLLLGAGCAGRDEARVERYENGAYRAEVVASYELGGARDGAATDATGAFVLANESHDTLRVYLHVTYNPTPVLADGRWELIRAGSTGESGDVREESLKFLGGQGAAPSVGGRFRLETNGEPRWRVVMPVQPLKK